MKRSRILIGIVTLLLAGQSALLVGCSNSDEKNKEKAQNEARYEKSRRAKLQQKLNEAEAEIAKLEAERDSVLAQAEANEKKAVELAEKAQALEAEQARLAQLAIDITDAQAKLESAKVEFAEYEKVQKAEIEARVATITDEAKKNAERTMALDELAASLKSENERLARMATVQTQITKDQDARYAALAQAEKDMKELFSAEYGNDEYLESLANNGVVPVLVTYHMKNIKFEKAKLLRNKIINAVNKRAGYKSANTLYPRSLDVIPASANIRGEAMVAEVDFAYDMVDSFVIETTAAEAKALRKELKAMAEARLVIVKGVSKMVISMNMDVLDRDGKVIGSSLVGSVLKQDADLSKVNIDNVSSYAFSNINNQMNCRVLSDVCMKQIKATGLLEKAKATYRWKWNDSEKSDSASGMLKNLLAESIANLQTLVATEEANRTGSSGERDAFATTGFWSRLGNLINPPVENNINFVREVVVSFKVQLVDDISAQNLIPVNDSYLKGAALLNSSKQKEVLQQTKSSLYFTMPVGQNDVISSFDSPRNPEDLKESLSAIYSVIK